MPLIPMSDRVIHNLGNIEELNRALSNGERTLLAYLDENLPPAWLIFAKPYLNGMEPDFVLFNLDTGLCFIQVKDGDNYVSKKENGVNKLYRKIGNLELEINKSHLDQLKHYITKLVRLLVPEISAAKVSNPRWKTKNFIKSAVYYHNLNPQKVKDLFGFDPTKDYSLNNSITSNFYFYEEDLKTKKITDILPGIDEKINNWNKDWNDEVLFRLNPPKHERSEGNIYRLSKKQSCIENLEPGYYRIKGVAGSGKTISLARKAAKLAHKDKKVLIVTFNKTLLQFIKKVISDTQYEFNWNNITLKHFHGFCVDLLNKNEIVTPRNRIEQILEKAKNLISVLPDYPKFNAILIDEGQDFQREWFDFLTEFLNKGNETVMVFCDKRQNIYDRNLDWLDKRIESGLPFGDWIELNTSFRLPISVARFANEFSQELGLEKEIRIDEVVEQREKLFDTEIILWENITDNSESACKEELYKAYSFLKEETPRGITILFLDNNTGKECVNYFRGKGVDKICEIFKCPDSQEWRQETFLHNESELIMSTIHSFKGWESDNIILYIHKEAYKSGEKLDAIIYTAITRTRRNLIVINANERYKQFKYGKSLDELIERKRKDKERAEKERQHLAEEKDSFKKRVDVPEKVGGDIQETPVSPLKEIIVIGRRCGISSEEIKKIIRATCLERNFDAAGLPKIKTIICDSLEDLRNRRDISSIAHNAVDSGFIIGQVPHSIAGVGDLIKCLNNLEARIDRNIKHVQCGSGNGSLSAISTSSLKMAIEELLNLFGYQKSNC